MKPNLLKCLPVSGPFGLGLIVNPESGARGSALDRQRLRSR